ncbi:hypothetical protein [Streptomyces sp. Ncost-T10-10d]|uniref:hypothetical protein n=1 Tax=Streptomyces sp. Ncost-T10-10d TaxID=1839774 RepID=UPI00081E4517|nr:hypothetical protein [Streptomyces sp. Ncost-T10-10d]SCF93243.1 hypothetical protein GA0115254_125411 [Streptomyces sp. Ncost-T10-10d]
MRLPPDDILIRRQQGLETMLAAFADGELRQATARISDPGHAQRVRRLADPPEQAPAGHGVPPRRTHLQRRPDARHPTPQPT